MSLLKSMQSSPFRSSNSTLRMPQLWHLKTSWEPRETEGAIIFLQRLQK